MWYNLLPKNTFSNPAQETDKLLLYRQRDDFLSAVELNFYRILRQTIGEATVICLKVSLGNQFWGCRDFSRCRGVRKYI